MANRRRGDNLQYSDDKESHPQSENTDTLATENLEICTVGSVTEENDDVETENNDSHEDIDRTEDTAESVTNTSSFLKKQIPKQPLKEMKKIMMLPVLYSDPLSNVNRGQKKGRLKAKILEDSKATNDPLYNFFVNVPNDPKNATSISTFRPN